MSWNDLVDRIRKSHKNLQRQKSSRIYLFVYDNRLQNLQTYQLIMQLIPTPGKTMSRLPVSLINCFYFRLANRIKNML